MATVRGYLRDLIKKRARHICEKCGDPIVREKNGSHNGSLHHRRPRRMGGPDWVSNLVFVCLDCHKWIHQNEPDAANEGWIVWTDPEVVPVKLRGKGWVLLVPDGTYEYITAQEAAKLLEWVEGIEIPELRKSA